MRNIGAVILAVTMSFILLSYTRPVMTAEDFTYTQILEESKVTKNCIDAERFFKCIDLYDDKYAPIEYISKEDFKKIAVRIARKESRFKQFAFNSGSGAHGIYQILHRYWGHNLWKIDDGKLGHHIKTKKITNVQKYYFRTGYNVELGCIAIAGCIKIAKGDLKKALEIYSGFSKLPKKITNEFDISNFYFKRDEYISYVLEIK